MAVTVERVTSFAGLEEAWSYLLHGAPHGNLFLSYEWASAWWAHFGTGADLWLLLVRDHTELIGIAPMMVRHVRYNGLRVRMLGMLHNKHVSRTDVIFGDRHEDVLRALVDYWKRHNRSWDVLRLEQVPLASPTLSALQAELGDSGMRPFPFEKTQDLYYLPGASSWEAYYKLRSDSFKKTFRLARNRLNRSGKVEFIKLTGAADVDAGFSAVWELEQRSWKRNDPFASNQANDKAFYRDLAVACLRADHAGYEIRLLKINGDLVAALSMIVFNGVLYLLHTCYDERHETSNPGRMLVANVIEEYLGHGEIREIDFNGESLFVRTWTDVTRAHGCISACNDRPYSTLLSFLKQVKRRCFERDGRHVRDWSPQPISNMSRRMS